MINIKFKFITDGNGGHGFSPIIRPPSFIIQCICHTVIVCIIHGMQCIRFYWMITKMLNVDKKTIERKPITEIINFAERVRRGLLPVHLHPRQRTAVQLILALPKVQIESRVHVGKSVITGDVRPEFNLSRKGKSHRDGVGIRAHEKHNDDQIFFHTPIIVKQLNRVKNIFNNKGALCLHLV